MAFRSRWRIPTEYLGAGRVQRALSRNRRLILLSFAVYAVGGAVGLLAGSTLDYAQLGGMGADSASAAQLSAPETLEIVKINLVVTLALLLGSITLGAVPLVLLFVNGVAHFYYASVVPVGSVETAVLLLPHGVLELPALWIAGAAGLRIPRNFLSYLRQERDGFVERRDVVDIASLTALSVLLILVAGVVETTVTPRLASLL